MWGLVCFLGCQSSWQNAAESQRPPRGSALACPHCLAGDRSDTEANTCSSEEKDLAKRWPHNNPSIHVLASRHTCENVYHPWQGAQNRSLRSRACHWHRSSFLITFYFVHYTSFNFMNDLGPSRALQMFFLRAASVVRAALRDKIIALCGHAGSNLCKCKTW